MILLHLNNTLSSFSQFLGKWYEILWIAPSYFDGGDLWINYYNVYNADDYGVVTGYYSGK